MTILIPVLGDQLSHDLASFRDVAHEHAVVLMMEVAEETTYVRHHKRKIALILSAMRHFADELRAAGFDVDYIRLDDPANSGSFTGEVERAVKRHNPGAIQIVEPGEWRVKSMIGIWAKRLGVPVEILPTTASSAPSSRGSGLRRSPTGSWSSMPTPMNGWSCPTSSE